MVSTLFALVGLCKWYIVCMRNKNQVQCKQIVEIALPFFSCRSFGPTRFRSHFRFLRSFIRSCIEFRCSVFWLSVVILVGLKITWARNDDDEKHNRLDVIFVFFTRPPEIIATWWGNATIVEKQTRKRRWQWKSLLIKKKWVSMNAWEEDNDKLFSSKEKYFSAKWCLFVLSTVSSEEFINLTTERRRNQTGNGKEWWISFGQWNGKQMVLTDHFLLAIIKQLLNRLPALPSHQTVCESWLEVWASNSFAVIQTAVLFLPFPPPFRALADRPKSANRMGKRVRSPKVSGCGLTGSRAFERSSNCH